MSLNATQASLLISILRELAPSDGASSKTLADIDSLAAHFNIDDATEPSVEPTDEASPDSANDAPSGQADLESGAE